MSLKWKGDELKKRIKKASAIAINRVIADAIVYALNHHPGWIYRTGVAEGSISQKDFATPELLVGRWGSIWSTARKKKGNTTNYVWFLEFNHGSFLRNSADVNYKNLTREIKQALKRV